jgi:hypothetical protein
LPLNICFIFFMVASFVFFVKKTGGKGARPLRFRLIVAIKRKVRSLRIEPGEGFPPLCAAPLVFTNPFAILFPFEYF